ncbi:FxSxx-COOH system tetratricopeptide repeat protein [Streptomyces malaysiensis]|uniref:FxSxx-COOH system tetratricopeptide repeat protein n=2 Tax=Streptomyces TaxID=1883 RepID=UPI00352B62F5
MLLTLAGVGQEAALALGSTASGAALTAGAWYAARGPQPVRPESAPLPDGPLVVGPLPCEPLAFQERAALIECVDAALTRQGMAVVCALTGGRGVGKTQLAASYARSRIDAGWRAVAWIVAEEPGQVVAGLDELAGAAGVKGGIQDAELAAAAARRWLERLPEPALLVLDNVVDPDEAARWLPRTGQTRTLLTSRVRSVTHLGATVDVGIFTGEQAVAFLREMTGGRDGQDDAAAVVELAEELGRLPLALAQAAWVIRAQGLTFAEYLERFHRSQLGHVMHRAPGDPYPLGAAEALLLAIEQVEIGGHASIARRVVELVSLLSPSGVHRHDLRAALADREAAELDSVLGRLSEASVVSLSLDGRTVLMHRLVQRIVRDRLAEEGRLSSRIEGTAAALRTLLTDGNERSSPDAGDRGRADHVLALWAAAKPLGDEARRALLDLPRTAVRLLADRAEVARACSVGRDVVTEHERLVPHQDDALVKSLNILAYAYHGAHRFDLAVPLRERSVDIHRARFGPDHPDTLAAMNSLGYALEGAGRLDEAEMVHRRNLADSLRINGPDHVTTMLAQINLASVLRARGADDEALALFEKNAADNERTMGPDHPRTLNALGELARMYERVGRCTESLTLHDRILTQVLHAHQEGDHHHLWWGRYRALALQGVGRGDEAINELGRLLDLSECRLGRDHPETLCIWIFLARAHSAAGHHTMAITLFEQCVNDRQRVLGAENRRTLNARRNLGLALLAAGKRSAANHCLEEVVADYENALGLEHPFTQGARANLARARTASRNRLRRPPAPSV